MSKPAGQKKEIQIVCPQSCEMNSIILHSEALDRIAGSSFGCTMKWLDDEATNAVLARILYYAQENGYGKDIYLFSSYFWERLTRNFKYACQVAMEKKSLMTNASKWLIPMCFQSHWNAAVVDVHNHSIEMLDSLHVQAVSQAADLRKFVKCICNPTQTWSIGYSKTKIPRQVNIFDCGVLMIKALENEIYDQFIGEAIINPNEGHQYRQEFLELINVSINGGDYVPPILRHKSHDAKNALPKRARKKFSLCRQKTNSSSNTNCSSNHSTSSNTPDGILISSPNTRIPIHPDSLSGLPEQSIDHESPQNHNSTDCNPPNLQDKYTSSLDEIFPCSPSDAFSDSGSFTNINTNAGFSDNSPPPGQSLFNTSHPEDNPIHASLDTSQKASRKIYLDQLGSTSCDKSCANSSPNVNHTSAYDRDQPYSWKELDVDLQSVLPPNQNYSYVLEEISKKDKAEFEGAPTCSFEAVIRINVSSESEARAWLDEMMKHSLTTYRVTRTFKPGFKRIKCKLEMHCQHQKKKLTPKQMHKSSLVKSKKARYPLTHANRDKKTMCPAKLKFVVEIPTKKQHRIAEKKPYLLTHTGILSISYCHNHPISSGHTLSFRDVQKETKEAFLELFSIGHSASTARHAHEQELMNSAETEAEMQLVLADRSQNPLVQDVCRLYTKWRESTYGKEDGKELFQSLEERVQEFNDKAHLQNGGAKLQWYEACQKMNFDEDDGDEDGSGNDMPKNKAKLSAGKDTPFILCVCTPLMARVHEKVIQCEELVFCDSTASLDRFNTAVYILSTAHCASGLPLGVILTSDEKEHTFCRALEMLKSILPDNAFYGRGPSLGPQVIMTDDNSGERGALNTCWPKSKLLLCTFHFLQRRWTWLWEGKNGVNKEHRKVLIIKVKGLIYASSESELNKRYAELKKDKTALLYQHFIAHIDSLMKKKQEWAHCYRKGLMIRGNHTNNYAEAGIKVLKELVFSRIKAYNIVQMFYFVVNTMESYYQRKLVSIANNRLETYFALRFKGVNAKKISPENVKKNHDSWYCVQSQSDPSVWHDVNPTIGVCSCTLGRDGSPCAHQASVVYQYGEESLNYICTMSAQSRFNIAVIALGDQAIQSATFYTSLHQEATEEKYGKQSIASSLSISDFNGTEWDLLRAGAYDTSEPFESVDLKYQDDNMAAKVDMLAADLKEKLASESEDDQLVSGIVKFVKRYLTLAASGRSNARLASALHQFGSTAALRYTTKSKPRLRHGRRIPIQATAAGRRRKGISRGKAKVSSGRPANSSSNKIQKEDTRYQLPTRKLPKGKRPHNLSHSILQCTQNAGKW